ncbi:hypothetical protein ILYODFUR_035272 [Ilyodon furcidens]|uniref:Uncharacterized protein n=1 Tax=Ilyodon furcidens TaxID=33524 RepID=A0ABV0V8S9_9TELE
MKQSYKGVLWIKAYPSIRMAQLKSRPKSDHQRRSLDVHRDTDSSSLPEFELFHKEEWANIYATLVEPWLKRFGAVVAAPLASTLQLCTLICLAITWNLNKIHKCLLLQHDKM